MLCLPLQLVQLKDSTCAVGIIAGMLSVHQLVEMPGKVRTGTWHAAWKAFATTRLMC